MLVEMHLAVAVKAVYPSRRPNGVPVCLLQFRCIVESVYRVAAAAKLSIVLVVHQWPIYFKLCILNTQLIHTVDYTVELNKPSAH
jgi:hypothetical protein